MLTKRTVKDGETHRNITFNMCTWKGHLKTDRPGLQTQPVKSFGDSRNNWSVYTECR